MYAGDLWVPRNALAKPDFFTVAFGLGPVAYYRMSGNVINVVTGQNNGAGVNGPTQVAGLIPGANLAYQFVGASSQFVDVTEAIGWPTGANPRTVLCWFRSNSATVSPLFSYGSAVANQNFVVSITAAGAINIDYNGASDTFGGGYANNATHFVASTYDGTNTRCYVDGSIVGAPSARALNTVVGASIWIATQGSAFATSIIDEVGIYPTALSAAAIANLYSAGT